MRGRNIFPQSNYFYCFVPNTKGDTRVMQVCPLLLNPKAVQGRCATSAIFSEMYINARCCADMTRSECLLIIYNISAGFRMNCQEQIACNSLLPALSINPKLTQKHTLIFQFNIIHYFSLCKEKLYMFSFGTKCSPFILMKNLSLRQFFCFGFLGGFVAMETMMTNGNA